MGRILDKDLYPLDGNLSLDDYVIGSDADSVGKITRNYNLGGILSTFQSALNLASITYVFSDGTDPDLDETDSGYFTTNSNETSAPAVTSININKTEANGQDISSFIDVVALQPTSFTLRLYKPSAIGQVFFFAISAVVDNTTHYTLTVSNFLGSNSLVDATTYSVVFDLSGVPSIYTETDPVFTASDAAAVTAAKITNWDTAFGWGNHAVAGYQAALGGTGIVKTTAGTISYITDNSANWNTAFGWGNHASAGYLTSYTETDPVFAASAAAGITAVDISQWDAAYGWGNHAVAGYLTSESDPIFAASIAAGITLANTQNWNTAYSWGDHDGIYLPLAGGTMTGNISMGGFELQQATRLDINNSVFSGSDTIEFDFDSADIFSIGKFGVEKLQYVISADEWRVDGFEIVTEAGGFTFSTDISVPDEVYGVGWNGSVEVPTKNAIYDKIEAVAATAGVTSFNSRTGAVVPTAGDYNAFYYTETETDSLLGAKVDVAGDTMTGDLNVPRVRITAVDDASLTSTLHGFQVGLTTGVNIIMDGNEIMARNNGVASDLFLNADGGTVNLGNATDVSFIVNGTSTFTNNLIFSSTSNTGILHQVDSERILIGGGSAWSGSNGAYIEVQGNDYGGVGLGKDINLQIPSGGELNVTQETKITGNLELITTNDTSDSVLRDLEFMNESNTNSDKRIGLLRVRNYDGATGTRGGYFQFATRRKDTALTFDFPLEVFGDLVNIQTNLDVSGNTEFSGTVLDSGGFIGAKRSGGSADGYRTMIGNSSTTNNFLVGGSTTDSSTSMNCYLRIRPVSSGQLSFHDGASIYTIWHSGNDGTGTGLDADLLDGVQGTSYLRSDANDVFTGTFLRWEDNNSARFGTSDDFRFLHDGTTNRVQLIAHDMVISDGLSTARFTFARTTGDLTATGDMNAVDFNASSDARLKDNIREYGHKPIEAPWAEWEWKNGGKSSTGLIAQQLELTHPEYVREDEKGMKSISYNQVFINKIAHLEKENENLKARLDRLELIVKELL